MNNAGVYGPMGSIDEVDWHAWTQAMDININGSVLPMAPSCRISSDIATERSSSCRAGSHQPLPRITAYAASKAAIVRLAESVALDVKDDGIDVNSIAPGRSARGSWTN